MSAQRILSRDSFQAYLELSIKLFKTHVIGVNTSNSLDMLMIMACVGKTNEQSKANCRANDAPASERHASLYVSFFRESQLSKKGDKHNPKKTRP